MTDWKLEIMRLERTWRPILTHRSSKYCIRIGPWEDHGLSWTLGERAPACPPSEANAANVRQATQMVDSKVAVE
jgi:hypothetical protein